MLVTSEGLATFSNNTSITTQAGHYPFNKWVFRGHSRSKLWQVELDLVFVFCDWLISLSTVSRFILLQCVRIFFPGLSKYAIPQVCYTTLPFSTHPLVGSFFRFLLL